MIANNKNHATGYNILVHMIANNKNHDVNYIMPWKLV